MNERIHILAIFLREKSDWRKSKSQEWEYAILCVIKYNSHATKKTEGNVTLLNTSIHIY